MNPDCYTSIKEAQRANKPKGSLWSVSFGPNERYVGHVFSTSPRAFTLVTKRGNLVFYPDEVKTIEWINDASVADIDRGFWPAAPFL